jgi:hypothetical protein
MASPSLFDDPDLLILVMHAERYGAEAAVTRGPVGITRNRRPAVRSTSGRRPNAGMERVATGGEGRSARNVFASDTESSVVTMPAAKPAVLTLDGLPPRERQRLRLLMLCSRVQRSARLQPLAEMLSSRRQRGRTL